MRLSLSQAIHSIPSQAIILSPCWGSWLEEQGKGRGSPEWELSQLSSCTSVLDFFKASILLCSFDFPGFFVCGRFCARVSQREVAETSGQPWLSGLGLHLLRMFETGSLIGLGLTSRPG